MKKVFLFLCLLWSTHGFADSFEIMLKNLWANDLALINAGITRLSEYEEEQLHGSEYADTVKALEEAAKNLRKAAKNAWIFGGEGSKSENIVEKTQETLFEVAVRLNLNSRKLARYALYGAFDQSPSAESFLNQYLDSHGPNFLRIFLSSKNYGLRLVASAYMLKKDPLNETLVRESLFVSNLDEMLKSIYLERNKIALIYWIRFSEIAKNNGKFLAPFFLNQLESLGKSNSSNEFFQKFYSIASKLGQGDPNTVNRLSSVYRQLKGSLSIEMDTKILDSLNYARTGKEDSFTTKMLRLMNNVSVIEVKWSHAPDQMLQGARQIANDMFKEKNENIRQSMIDDLIAQATFKQTVLVFEILIQIGGPDMRIQLRRYNGCDPILNALED